MMTDAKRADEMTEVTGLSRRELCGGLGFGADILVRLPADKKAALIRRLLHSNYVLLRRAAPGGRGLQWRIEASAVDLRHL
jgi:hypothetical protein